METVDLKKAVEAALFNRALVRAVMELYIHDKKPEPEVEGTDVQEKIELDDFERLEILKALSSACGSGEFHALNVPRLAKELFDAAVMLRTAVSPFQGDVAGLVGGQTNVPQPAPIKPVAPRAPL